jgi:uncharacterized protein (TIGR02118 family)
MIIRSGLICNRKDVSREAFDRHWLDVHGPLARVVPNLRAYTQNHVLTQLTAAASEAQQQIDGISQLWFDSVDAMNDAMRSVEQQRCVEDIKGFLSAVTIVIQQPGEWISFGTQAHSQQKVMAVLGGRPLASGSYADDLRRSFAMSKGGRLRVNPAIEHGYSVNRDVPPAHGVVAAIAELWFNDPEEIPSFVRSTLRNGFPSGIECVAALHVEEFVILRAPADAGADNE